MKGSGGSPWDVPGLGVDVDALLGDKPNAATPAPPAPTRDARAIVSDSPELAVTVERCQDALVAARHTLHDALGGGHTHDAPEVEAWMALLDEVLNFGQAVTGALLGPQSQSIRRNQ